MCHLRRRRWMHIRVTETRRVAICLPAPRIIDIPSQSSCQQSGSGSWVRESFTGNFCALRVGDRRAMRILAQAIAAMRPLFFNCFETFQIRTSDPYTVLGPQGIDSAGVV